MCVPPPYVAQDSFFFLKMELSHVPCLALKSFLRLLRELRATVPGPVCDLGTDNLHKENVPGKKHYAPASLDLTHLAGDVMSQPSNPV